VDSSDELQDLVPATPTDSFGGDHVAFGVTIPKQKRLEILDEDEWEAFVEEWATSLKDQYPYVKRHSGPGDKGLDVVGLLVSEQLADGYDNYQCKHYDHAKTPFHTVRFGGGLPARPPVEIPTEMQPEETRFTEQLLEA
jgi:hypothetical protein